MSANQLAITTTNTNPLVQSLFLFPNQQQSFQNQQSHITWDPPQQNPNPSNLNNTLTNPLHHNIKPESPNFHTNLSSPPPPLPFLHHTNPKSIMTSSPFHVSTQQNSSSATMSPHLSATALLQKAATVGAAAITGSQPPMSHHQTSQPSLNQFGSVTQLDSVDHYINNMRGCLTGKNDDGLTRDFLGLTNGGGNGGDSLDVKDMLTFTGGVEYHQHQPHQNMMMLKSQSQQAGFGFLGTTTVPESWGNC